MKEKSIELTFQHILTKCLKIWEYICAVFPFSVVWGVFLDKVRRSGLFGQ